MDEVTAKKEAADGGFELGIGMGNFRANSKALAEAEGEGVAKVMFNQKTRKVRGGPAASAPGVVLRGSVEAVTLPPYHPIQPTPNPNPKTKQQKQTKQTKQNNCTQVLGVHIVGLHAADLIQECANAIELGTTIDELAMITHTHPTLSEVLDEVRATFELCRHFGFGGLPPFLALPHASRPLAASGRRGPAATTADRPRVRQPADRCLPLLAAPHLPALSALRPALPPLRARHFSGVQGSGRPHCALRAGARAEGGAADRSPLSPRHAAGAPGASRSTPTSEPHHYIYTSYDHERRRRVAYFKAEEESPRAAQRHQRVAWAGIYIYTATTDFCFVRESMCDCDHDSAK